MGGARPTRLAFSRRVKIDAPAEMGAGASGASGRPGMPGLPGRDFYCHACKRSFIAGEGTTSCAHCNDDFIEEMQRPGGDEEEDGDGGEGGVDEGPQLDTLPDGRRVIRLNAALVQSLRALIEDGDNVTAADLFLNLSRFALASPEELAAARAQRELQVQRSLDRAVENSMAGAVPTGPERRPAPQAAVDALEWVDVDDGFLSSCSECSVCFEEFAVGEKLRRMPCKHAFHNECLLEWMTRMDECPVCRAPVCEHKPDGAEEEAPPRKRAGGARGRSGAGSSSAH